LLATADKKKLSIFANYLTTQGLTRLCGVVLQKFKGLWNG